MKVPKKCVVFRSGRRVLVLAANKNQSKRKGMK